MITRADKTQEVDSLLQKFSKAKAAFLIDFKGMKVGQVTELRKKLHPAESEMKVVRNTLAKLALKKYPDMDKALSSSLKGTNAIVFAYGDVSVSAKVISAFAKDVEALKIRTGAMDGRQMDQTKIQFLSTLPSKDVLRAQFLGVLQAPAGKLVRTINEVPTALVRVLAAKKD